MKNSKLVRGVGFNDNIRPTSINGKFTKEYSIWLNMLRRCYCKKYQANKPTYVLCSVSENFKSYSFFYDWCNTQIGYGIAGFELDKDILVRDNKIYSEDACIFVPKEVNIFFSDCGLARGKYPVGVYFDKDAGKYKARCSVNGKLKHLGYFNAPDDAHAIYKQFKEDLCKETAKKWHGQIDPRVYESLMNWSMPK
jgi:hypothetical protein